MQINHEPVLAAGKLVVASSSLVFRVIRSLHSQLMPLRWPAVPLMTTYKSEGAPMHTAYCSWLATVKVIVGFLCSLAKLSRGLSRIRQDLYRWPGQKVSFQSCFLPL